MEIENVLRELKRDALHFQFSLNLQEEDALLDAYVTAQSPTKDQLQNLKASYYKARANLLRFTRTDDLNMQHKNRDRRLWWFRRQFGAVERAKKELSQRGQDVFDYAVQLKRWRWQELQRRNIRRDRTPKFPNLGVQRRWNTNGTSDQFEGRGSTDLPPTSRI